MQNIIMRKYRNKICKANGYTFHSQKERKRYQDLLLLEKTGEINNIQLQPVFPIIINGFHVCKVIPDFSYINLATKRRIVEDVKSPITRKESTYRLKKKLLFAAHGIEITEI